MEIREVRRDGLAVLELSGRIDSHTAPELEKRIQSLIDTNETKLLIDFSRLDFISSAGLRVILWGIKTLKTQNGALAISAMNSNVKGVFEVSGFKELTHTFDDIDSAFDFLKAYGDTVRPLEGRGT